MRRVVIALLTLSTTLALAACGSSSSSSTSSSAATSASSTASLTPAAGGAQTASCATVTGAGASGPATLPTGKPGAGKPAVTLGDKNFPEEYVLGDLYADALKARGFSVSIKGNIGSSELIYQALKNGDLGVYPEYTGVLLSTIAKQNKTPASATATYDEANTYVKAHGSQLLNATPFCDTDAIGVLASYATAHHLASVADIKALGKSFVIAGAPEFATRFEGLLGLKQLYGLDPGFKPLAIGLQYTALDAGQVQGADVFTTDGQLTSGKYTLLRDPKNVFGFQNVAPLVSKKVLAAEGPAFEATLNAVSSKLTTQAMQQMNGAVTINKDDPNAVAQKFLAANGLT